MENLSPKNRSETLKIRVAFDEVLIKHIRRLMEIASPFQPLYFNIPTLTCLFLLVERENEIKNFNALPPERYNRKSFLDDLANIGFEVNDDLMVAFQTLAQNGYVEIGIDDCYHPQLSAFETAKSLDNLFPEMPGMNLVAYTMQTIEEVVSGRKSLKNALNQFDQMLLLKGLPISKQEPQEGEAKSADGPGPTHGQGQGTTRTEDLKQANRQRLSKIRSSMVTARSSKPAIYTRTGIPDNLEIKELFPKTSHEIKDNSVNQYADIEEKKSDRLKKPEEDALPPVIDFDAEEKACISADVLHANPYGLTRLNEDSYPEAIFYREKNMSESKEGHVQKDEKENIYETETFEEAKGFKNFEIEQAAVIEQDNYQQMISDPERKPEPADMKMPASEESNLTRETVPEMQSLVSAEENIEERIKVFQDELAIRCPICNVGSIYSKTTGKKKKYYSCSNENCKFISWGKPYHFECPLCKNSFLIEFTTQSGNMGLKCPRASCTYIQENLNNPSRLQKGRKKVVRRVVRKRR